MTVHVSMSHEEMMAEIVRLREINDRLRQRKQGSLSMKVSEKGALSVYGLGRFPVTLYKGQWERLIEAVPAIKQFIGENVEALASKE